MSKGETLKTSDCNEECCNNIVFCNISENCGILEWKSEWKSDLKFRRKVDQYV